MQNPWTWWMWNEILLLMSHNILNELLSSYGHNTPQESAESRVSLSEHESRIATPRCWCWWWLHNPKSPYSQLALTLIRSHVFLNVPPWDLATYRSTPISCPASIVPRGSNTAVRVVLLLTRIYEKERPPNGRLALLRRAARATRVPVVGLVG